MDVVLNHGLNQGEAHVASVSSGKHYFPLPWTRGTPSSVGLWRKSKGRTMAGVAIWCWSNQPRSPNSGQNQMSRMLCPPSHRVGHGTAYFSVKSKPPHRKESNHGVLSC